MPFGNDRGRSSFLGLSMVALVLATILVVILCVFPALCFDMWWHLRTGELILEQGSVPDADPFSYTAHGRTWITHEWLAEVLFFGLHNMGGVNLLIIFKALVAGLAVFLGATAALVY